MASEWLNRNSIPALIMLIMAACSLVPQALAQDTVFTDLAGHQVTLSSMQGKVVVIVFSGTNDPQCRDEFKALNGLAERYSGKPVSLCWVSTSPAGAISNDRLKAQCGSVGSVVVLRDPGQAAFKRFSKSQSEIPTIVILDQKGLIRGDAIAGFNPDSDFVNLLAGIIDSLLAQPK